MAKNIDNFILSKETIVAMAVSKIRADAEALYITFDEVKTLERSKLVELADTVDALIRFYDENERKSNPKTRFDIRSLFVKKDNPEEK